MPRMGYEEAHLHPELQALFNFLEAIVPAGDQQWVANKWRKLPPEERDALSSKFMLLDLDSEADRAVARAVYRKMWKGLTHAR